MMVWLAIGAALAALAATAPLRWGAAIVVLCLPLSGTAVLMLGTDPIVLPLIVTIGFLARYALNLYRAPVRRQFWGLARGDLALIAFAVYCVVSGVFFPRLFAGATTVFPQVFVLGGVPLGPQLVSYVQIAYLLLGVMLVMALRMTMLRVGLEWIILTLMAQAALFGGFGLVQAMFGVAHIQVPTGWIVNNEGYALLTRVIEHGFVRVTSVFVEASSFAVWATGALAFAYALYINRIFPKWNLALAGMLSFALLLSTSSTAYFGLLFVGAVAILQVLLDASQARRERELVVLFIAMIAICASLLIVLSTNEGFLGDLRTMIEQMTINKGASSSGIDRGRMASTSVQNAIDTALLGTGYGSARSSGLISQLIGTIGAPGLILFVIAFAPLIGRAFRRPKTGEDAVACAGAFALFCTLGAMAASAADLALPNMFWVYAAVAAAPLAERAARREAMQRGKPSPDAGEREAGETA